MNININLEILEKEILDMRAKVCLLKFIDAEASFASSDVPKEIKELLFGVTSVSENLFVSLENCLDKLNCYICES
nr:hypothetical protein [Pseudodesulfovibrio sp.]